MGRGQAVLLGSFVLQKNDMRGFLCVARVVDFAGMSVFDGDGATSAIVRRMWCV